MVLAALETSAVISDMDISCFGLHRLKGELNGRWSVYVSGNWRVTFRFEAGHAYDLNYEDYH